jgi:UDP-N-acetylmuramoyl-L-alanyl-D-glutamate--2,6-diaminopimelate ligase
MNVDAVALSSIVARLERDGLLVDAPAALVGVQNITDDSRAVAPGDLFCAWAGTSTDAHEFVAAAQAQGAVAALVERRVEGVTIPQVLVSHGRHAAASAAQAFFADPQDQLTIVGVTGTNGKTTTVWMLRHLLSANRPAASIGTIGVVLEDGTVLPGSERLTTPGPVDLVRIMRLLADRGVSALAMEVSSHALHQGRVSSLHFDVAVFTNLTRDHLDYHGTMESYLAAKRSLVTLLRPNGCAVINADDTAWAGLDAESPRARTFSVNGQADVGCDAVRLGTFGSRFTLHAGGEAADAHLPLLGDFNVSNALAAAAACLALGYPLDAVARALETVPQVPGRLERIADEPCSVLRDYAHTPDALTRVLTTLRPLTDGRIIVVFGAGGDRDRGKRPMMGAAAQAGADVVIVTSDNPRTEDPDRIIDDITAGMHTGYIRITDRREAIARALHTCSANDIVLLAGKGHETYQVIGREKRPFDERAIVGALVQELGHDWGMSRSAGARS